MKRLLACSALLLAAGCDSMVGSTGPAPVYALWEEGRTLVFRNPSMAGTQPLQVRVKRSEVGPGGRTVVETFSTLAGESEVSFRQKDGLVGFKVDANTEINILPQGFPDRVTRWVDRGFINYVVGRSRVDLPGVDLPDPDATGVWIESVPPAAAGVRRRTLLVPDLGEVETLNWKDGRWVVVNILTSQGFTDQSRPGSER